MDATFGHDDGEAVLARLAQTLQPQLRASDAMGRWGADEFLIVLKIKDVADMAVVAGWLRDALSDAGNPFCAGLSIAPAVIKSPLALATLDDLDDAPTDAITRADASLHLAKMAAAMAKDEAVPDKAVNEPIEVEDEQESKRANAA